MEKAEAIHVQPNSDTTMGPAAACGFSGCIMPAMASSGQGSERLNAQLLVDSIPALIHTATPDGYLDYFNKPWLEYLGVTLDKVTGWNWTAYVHTEDVEGIVAKWRACLATGEVFEYETRVRRADGEYRWMFHRKVPLRDANGNVAKWYGSSFDIEERKRTELALQWTSCDLQESKSKLEEAQRITHVGYWEWDVLTDRVNWSDETYRIYGLRPQEYPMDLATLRKKIHPEDWEGLFRALEEALSGGARYNAECRVFRPTGEVRIIHSQGDVKRDTAGRPTLMFGTVQDITERKQAENKIRRLVDANILGVFVGNIQGSIVEANDAFLRLLQYDRQDLLLGRLRWTNLTPAELWGRDEDALAKLQASGSIQPYEKEFFRKDGSRVPVLIGGALFQEGGNEGVVFVLDLSEQKQAEDKIREQESELRQILDFTPQLIAVYGPNWERLYINRVALDYLGLTLDAWRQQRTFGAEDHHPDDSAQLEASMRRALSSGSGFESEVRVRKADGSYRWFLARFNPVRDEQEQIVRWYVAATDINERKRAEERLQHENVALREELDKASMFEEIVGTSPALKNVLSRISKVAPSYSTVLITGETGTGKELVARAIHRRSDRASRAFVSVNCAAIPRDLIASELFGHEKGAFTGATQQRLGRFELANGGTIFLDEVGELPAETQIALLRVLQEREFERVGGSRRIRTDVRVIAATNRDLQTAISAGSFRSDLFYRLHVFPIEMPSLRERREDIPLLVEYFIDRYARKAGKNIKRVNKKTLELLQSYPWPGNIRELQNVIERSVILCETDIFSIDENWLPQPPLTADSKQQVELPQRLLVQEKDMIEAALKETRGRVSGSTGAAVKLGIPRSTLESKIRSLKINKNRFRSIPGT